MRLRVTTALVPCAVALLALGGGAAHAVDPVVPADHQEFLSSGGFTPELGSLQAPSGPTGKGAPPRVGPNLRVNAAQVLPGAGLLGRSETAIAATLDGSDLVAGWNDAQGFCGQPFGAACTPQSPPGLSGYAFSTDGGLTWTDGGAPPVLNHVFTRGDPWLARGGTDGGTFFYANLAVDDRDAAVSLGVSVHRGGFSGAGFSWNDVRTFDSPNNPGNCVAGQPPTPAACDFYDKESITAQPGTGNAYVTLTNFQGQPTIAPGCGNQAQFGFGQIEVWRTHDGGNTWQGPALAGPEAADSVASCGNTGTLQQSSVAAVGPNGEVYDVWQFGPTFTPATSTDADIDFARSLDGGATFSAPSKVADINSLRQNPPVGYNRDRINDHPRVAVATTGKFKGRVYAVYYSSLAPVVAPPATAAACLTPVPANTRCRPQTLTSSQVFLRFSDDRGATWSPEIALAPTPPATGVKRFWPVVTVEPGGDVDVVFYESQERQATADPTDVECDVNLGGGIRRQGLNSSLVDTWWVHSSDGGATFGAPTRMTSATSNWCKAVSNIRPNFGDYIGSASGGNRVLTVWGDGRNGAPDTFYASGLAAKP